jgi:hypothetical protein
MGQSARGKIAWGIDLGDRVNTTEGFDWEEFGTSSLDFEQQVMPGMFGFTEQVPDIPEGMSRDEWRATLRARYQERYDRAVPLTFEDYGYERGGTALVLKRSLTSSEWEAAPVDPVTLAPPTAAEYVAFLKVLKQLGVRGWDGETETALQRVELLLLASYS